MALAPGGRGRGLWAVAHSRARCGAVLGHTGDTLAYHASASYRALQPLLPPLPPPLWHGEVSSSPLPPKKQVNPPQWCWLVMGLAVGSWAQLVGRP